MHGHNSIKKYYFSPHWNTNAGFFKPINYVKFIRLFVVFTPFACFSQLSTNPSPFEVEQSVTITVDINSSASNCNGIVAPQSVYMHAGMEMTLIPGVTMSLEIGEQTMVLAK